MRAIYNFALAKTFVIASQLEDPNLDLVGANHREIGFNMIVHELIFIINNPHSSVYLISVHQMASTGVIVNYMSERKTV